MKPAQNQIFGPKSSDGTQHKPKQNTQKPISFYEAVESLRVRCFGKATGAPEAAGIPNGTNQKRKLLNIPAFIG